MPYDPGTGMSYVGTGNPYYGSGFTNFDKYLQQQNLDWGAQQNAFINPTDEYDRTQDFNNWMIEATHPNGFPKQDQNQGGDINQPIEPPGWGREGHPPGLGGGGGTEKPGQVWVPDKRVPGGGYYADNWVPDPRVAGGGYYRDQTGQGIPSQPSGSQPASGNANVKKDAFPSLSRLMGAW